MYCENRTYRPKIMKSDLIVQSNQVRNLYDTSELVSNMLGKEYLSDAEILANRDGITQDGVVLDKEQHKRLRRRKVW